MLERSKAALLLALALVSSGAAAQYASDALADWNEADTPPPPALDLRHLQSFDVDPRSALKYALDPASLKIGSDGVVRYVVVASVAGGATNAMYEGIRCASAQVKTYARFNDGGWKPVPAAEWQSLYEAMPSRHALSLAAQGVCKGTVPADSVAMIIRGLKYGGNVPAR
jgi:hypothetical protein